MLINLRNALMAGKRLPYDAEVEFLQSTGTQWIDTGIVSQNNLVYDFDVYEQVLNTQRRFFGFKEGSSWYSPGMNDANWGNSWFYIDFASKESRALGNERPVKTFNRYHFDFTDGQASFSFNSTVRWTSGDIGTYDGSRHVFIFDMDSIFTTSTSHGIGRISFFQIRKNGILLRDFIPVRKGTVGYMYDRVSGKLFGNAGSGDFVLGPDKN